MEPIPAFNVELDPVNGAFLCSSINLLEKMQKICKRKSEIFSTFNFNISTDSLVRIGCPDRLACPDSFVSDQLVNLPPT